MLAVSGECHISTHLLKWFAGSSGVGVISAHGVLCQAARSSPWSQGCPNIFFPLALSVDLAFLITSVLPWDGSRDELEVSFWPYVCYMYYLVNNVN